MRLLSRWLDPLLEAGQLAAQPMLQVLHAWAVCLARGPRARRLLERLEQRTDDDAEVRAHRLAMKPLLMVLTDRIDEAMPLTTELLVALPAEATFARGFLEVVLANLAMIMSATTSASPWSTPRAAMARAQRRFQLRALEAARAQST